MPPTAPTPKPTRPILGRIGAVLTVLQTLIAHARHFATIATSRVDLPEFAPAAAVFGTYDIPVILHRMQRGILRALALQRYLLARAARGRNLRFEWPPYVALQPHHRPPAHPAPAKRAAPTRPRFKDPALLGPDDPAASYLPTPEELDAWVRRCPVGRSVAYICMDLGILPILCDGTFWNKVDRVLQRYGGNLHRLYNVHAPREKTFLRERDRRPDTWHINWRGSSKAAIRDAFGYLIGEALPPQDQRPVIVPS